MDQRHGPAAVRHLKGVLAGAGHAHIAAGPFHDLHGVGGPGRSQGKTAPVGRGLAAQAVTHTAAIHGQVHLPGAQQRDGRQRSLMTHLLPGQDVALQQSIDGLLVGLLCRTALKARQVFRLHAGVFPLQHPGPGPQAFAADLQLFFTVGQFQLQFFPVRQHVVPGDVVGKMGAPGLHEAKVLPAGSAQIDQGGRQRQPLQGIFGEAVAAMGQLGHQQRALQQQAGKPHAPETVGLAVVQFIGQIFDLLRRTAAQLAQAMLAQKIIEGRGLQTGQRLGQGQGCGRLAGKIAGRGLGRLVGIGIGDAFGDHGHGVENLMAKRWRQHPGACGPTPEARPARHPPQGGMGDADTALQEDRGTDTTAGDRGGKAVKRRTRPSLSPGQDGRKITEKGWANNGPPLEVP